MAVMAMSSVIAAPLRTPFPQFMRLSEASGSCFSGMGGGLITPRTAKRIPCLLRIQKARY
jgi:hypothetical protein